jgi:hypothetical protein
VWGRAALKLRNIRYMYRIFLQPELHMPYSPQHVPTYRHRKSRDLAVVTINGKDIYLGKFNSPESRREYDKLIQEWLASGRVMTSETPIEEESFSIAELIIAYMKHATVFYQKDGKPTSHLHNVEDAMTYQYSLMQLRKNPLRNFPGLVLLDFPAQLEDGTSVADKENFVLEPFLKLCEQLGDGGSQVIAMGSAFKDLSVPNRIELTQVWE